MRWHVSRVVQIGFHHLRWIRAVCKQLGRDVTSRLVTALVLSSLDYCNAVLAGIPTFKLAPFPRILVSFVDLKRRHRVSVTPDLREFHWLPVMGRIQYKLCLLVHKSLSGQTPDYILDTAPDLHCVLCRVMTSLCRWHVDELVTGPSLLTHGEHWTGCCHRLTHFSANRKHFFLIPFAGTKEQTDLLCDVPSVY